MRRELPSRRCQEEVAAETAVDETTVLEFGQDARRIHQRLGRNLSVRLWSLLSPPSPPPRARSNQVPKHEEVTALLDALPRPFIAGARHERHGVVKRHFIDTRTELRLIAATNQLSKFILDPGLVECGRYDLGGSE